MSGHFKILILPSIILLFEAALALEITVVGTFKCSHDFQYSAKLVKKDNLMDETLSRTALRKAHVIHGTASLLLKGNLDEEIFTDAYNEIEIQLTHSCNENQKFRKMNIEVENLQKGYSELDACIENIGALTTVPVWEANEEKEVNHVEPSEEQSARNEDMI